MNENNVQEIIIGVIGKLELEYPNLLNQQKIKQILEEELYGYTITKTEMALVIRNDVADKIKLFLASKTIEGLSLNTIKHYAYILRHFSQNIHKNIVDIDAMDIRMYLTEYTKDTGISKSTLENKIDIFRSLFGWLHENEYIEKNPMIKIKRMKTEKKMREPLTQYQVEEVRDACDTIRSSAIYEFLLATGLRVSELQQLNKDDIDMNNMKVKVLGKGQKERIVYFNEKAKLSMLKYLNSRVDDNEALIVGSKYPYDRFSVRGIEREVDRIGKKVNTNVFPHLLRNTFGTTLYNKSSNIVTVSKLLGHSSVQTSLNHYVKTSDKNIEYEYRKNIN